MLDLVQSNKATGTASAPTCAFNTAPTQGNLLKATCTAANNTAGALAMTSQGWLPCFTSNVNIGAWWKIAGTSESETVALGAVTAGWGLSISERDAQGAVVQLASGSGATQNNAAGATQTTPTVTPPAGTVALVDCAIAIRGAPVTISNQAINGSASGVSVVNAISANGVTLNIFDEVVASTSGSYQGSATASNTADLAYGAISVFTVAKPVAKIAPRLMFDASGSVPAAAGDTLTPTWTFSPPAGSAATLLNTNTLTPSCAPDVNGNYEATLTLTDSDGAVSQEVTYTYAWGPATTQGAVVSQWVGTKLVKKAVRVWNAATGQLD